MFVCLFVCLLTGLFFILIILELPQEYNLKISWRSHLIWLRYFGSKIFIFLFVCLFVFVLIILRHRQEVTLKNSWISDLIWLRYSRSKTCLFCLFVCLFVFDLFFYFNHLGTPIGIYPENFMKIGLYLAEIYRILKNVYLFVCLFVCLLNCLFFILIILGHPQEYTLKISWGSDLIWLRY